MARRTATFTLLRSVKSAWLKALRSGEYEQAEGELYDHITKGYCCLGVLCRILGKTDEEMKHETMPQYVGIGGELTPTDKENPSKHDNDVYAWSVRYNGRLTPLSTLNDTKRLSFEKIADLIDRHVPTHR